MNIGFGKRASAGKEAGRRGGIAGICTGALDQAIHDIISLKRALLYLGACFFFLWLLTGSICPMHAVTGIPCPGCGLTRAGLRVLMLDFDGAWRMNPFIFPIGILLLIRGTYRYLLRRKPGKWFSLCTAVILAGLVVFYIWRMVCFFPGEAPVNYLESCLAERIL